MRTTIALLLGFLAQLAIAAAPQTGIWWSRSESGRGYSIDVQGSTLVLLMYGYDAGGRTQWYYADGPLLNGGARWSGTLFKFDFGQALGGPYVAPVNEGNDGVATIDFTTRTNANLTLPGGRVVPIERYNFAVGTAPQSLLGEWIYVYSIGSSTFAGRYRYTRVLAATSTGNGVVANSAGTAAAEYQVVGELAGMVVAAEFTTAGSVLNSYLYTQYLEEGRGYWVSLVTETGYDMNAYRVASPSGMTKEERTPIGGAPRMISQEPITLEELAERNPALGAAVRRMWARVGAMRD